MAEAKAVSVNSLLADLAKNDVLRQLLILVGIAASVAIGGAAVMWSQGSEYRTLYSSLPPERAASVVDALDLAGIRYRIQDATGAIQVPSEELHNARMRLAGQGLTRDSSGMAMLEKEQGFGVSEFMQSKKYHYALEQELANTIKSMQQVRQARVHLAIPKQSVFVRDRKTPSASIMLDVYPGAVVSRQNVSAIVNLVASSIGGMKPEDVTVIDQLGQQLSETESENDGLELSDRQFSYRQRIEKAYEERVEDLIRPIAGSGRVRVKVAADIDFTTEQQSRESWNPDRQVVRSEQISEQNMADGAGVATGVPGALSNQPPIAGVPEGAGATDGKVNSRSVVRNYEIERVLAHSSNPSGAVNKLSVAVLVDNPRSTNEEGERVVEPLSNPEIERMTLLVKDAVGFDAARGDRVTVIAADFREEGMFDRENSEPKMWEQPWFANLARQVLVGLALLLLVFAVLRPGMRSLLGSQAKSAAGDRSAAEVNRALSGPDSSLSGEYVPPAAGQLGGPANDAESATQRRRGLGFEQKLGDVRGMVDEDPRRVAQVVNKWVSENNG